MTSDPDACSSDSSTIGGFLLSSTTRAPYGNSVQLGVTFPQTEIGPDPDTIVRFGRIAEESGYDFIAAYDHVLGADTAGRPDWRGLYTLHSQFHEIFLLFAYLAAHTTLELSSNVLVLPQR